MRRAAFLACATLLALTPGLARAEEPPRQPVSTLDVGAAFGGGARLGNGPYFRVSDASGFVAGASTWLSPEPRYGLGLTYEHLGLGREAGGNGANGTVLVDRSAHALWLGLRVFPSRDTKNTIYLELGPGILFQRAHAVGLISNGEPSPKYDSVACDASDSADFGLRMGLGGEMTITRSLILRAGGAFSQLHLSSKALSDCVNGAGSLSELSFTAGLAYRWDVSGLVR